MTKTRDENKNYRYPGSHPFADDDLDSRLFFGREAETNELYYQLLSTNLLVLYGKSGLGKTSLLQAGIFPQFRENGFLPLSVRLNQPDQPVMEVFTQAITKACEVQGVDYTPGETGGLWEFFKTAVFWRAGDLQTPVLVLDQFEEIFTLHGPETRRQISKELGDLLGNRLPDSVRTRREAGETLPYSLSPPTVKVLLSLRESHLGALEELTSDLPRILANRYRLMPMSRECAQRAVLEPAHQPQNDRFLTPPFEYSESALGEILDFLAGKTGEIEPFELQILCSHLERTLVAHKAERGQTLLIRSEDLGGRKGMETVLATFYRSAIASLPKRRLRKRARRLCAYGLLSPDGFRLSIEEGHLLRTFKVGKEALGLLVNERVLRKEPRLDSFYYELSHDSLVKPILKSKPWKMPRALRFSLVIAATIYLIVGLYGYLRLENEKKLLLTTQKEQDRTIKLIEYMTFELREKLYRINQIGLIEEVTDRVIEVYSDLSRSLDSNELNILGIALLIKGDIFVYRGELYNSIDTYSEAIKFFYNAINEYGNYSYELERNLAITFTQIGAVQMEAKLLYESIENSKTAIEIFDLISELRDYEVLKIQAWSLLQLGDAYMEAGKLDEALENYDRARELIEELDAENQDVYLEIAACADRVGQLHLIQFELGHAAEEFDLLDAALKESPPDPDLRRNQIVALYKKGELQLSGLDHAFSLFNYNMLFTIQNGIYFNKKHQFIDWFTYEFKSSLKKTQIHNQNSLKLARELYESEHKISLYSEMEDLSSTYLQAGMVYTASADFENALRACESGKAFADEILKIAPDIITAKEKLIVAWNWIGRLHLFEGQITEARVAHQSAEKAFYQMPEHYMDLPGGQVLLASIEDGLGDVHLAEGNLDEAYQSYAKALQIRDRLVQISPGHAQWQLALSVSFHKLGALERIMNSSSEAGGTMQHKSLQILDSLADRGQLPPLAQGMRNLISQELLQGTIP